MTNKSTQPVKGLLPVNPAALNQTTSSPPKSTARLKLLVRRLPPALTKDEFLNAFGEEWMPAAGGKVDWFEYRQGKVKTSSANLSEQSRAYIHLVSEAHIKPFESKFLDIIFHDAKGSYKDPNLKHLTPSLEFAPNQRIPVAKQRVDGRQGTIDQDSEFIAFLAAETEPVTKPAALDAVSTTEKPHGAISSTPLLDDLREKKANKAKAASSKPAKPTRGDHKEDKPVDKPVARRGDPESATKSSKQPAKSVQPVKESVRIATKQPANSNSAAKSNKSAPAQPQSAASASQQQDPVSPAPARKQRDRDRMTPNSIKTLLQRDLGLAPAPKRANKPNPGAAAKSAASAGAGAAASPDVSSPTSATSTPPLAAVNASTPAKQDSSTKPAKPQRTRKGNAADKSTPQNPVQDDTKSASSTPSAILKKAPVTQPASKAGKPKANNSQGGNTTQPSPSPAPAQSPSQPKPAKTASQPAVRPVKAYLKHANASQGITEPLIVTALSTFGDVVKVDIDKRKGTAIAEFKNHEGLKAAMAKRSVPVAQGAVEVLEFRERPAPAAAAAATARSGGNAKPKGRPARNGAATTASTTAADTPASPAPAASPSPAIADAT